MIATTTALAVTGCVASSVERLTKTIEIKARPAPINPTVDKVSPRKKPTPNGIIAPITAEIGATTLIGPSAKPYIMNMYPTVPAKPAAIPALIAPELKSAPKNGIAINNVTMPVTTITGSTFQIEPRRVAKPPQKSATP